MENETIVLTELKVKKKTFEKDGKQIEYNDYFVTLFGKNISLYPNTNNKELFKFLVAQTLEDNGEC